MLTRIRLTNDDRSFDSVDITLDGSSGYVLEDVTGLEPTEATLSYSNYAGIDGASYHSGNVNARNMVVTVGFEPDYAANQTVSELRQRLYRVGTPTQVVVIRFYTDGVLDRLLTGRIESLNNSIFSKEPQVQISIICTQPHMRGSSELYLEGFGTGIQTIDYEGDVSRGFTCLVRVLENINWIEVRNESRSGTPTLRVTGPFSAGQRVFINTNVRNKEARIVDSNFSTIERISGRMSVTNGWPDLYFGENDIRVTTNFNSRIETDLTYRHYYGGY